MNPVIIDQGEDLASYYSHSIDDLYHQITDYLIETYHTFPSDLTSTPTTDIDLTDAAYYESLAHDTADEISDTSIEPSIPLGKMVF